MPTRNLLTLNKQPRHLAPLFMPGGASYQARLKALFGSNLIQYLPLSEGPPGPSSLTFNGSTTNVNFGSGASLDDLFAADFTFDFWIKIDRVIQNAPIISKYLGPSVNTDGFSCYMTDATDNPNTRLSFYINFATTDINYATTLSITAGEWTHVAFFWDFSALKIRAAINGVWTNLSAAGAGAYATDAANDLEMSASNTFNGGAGWFRISNNDRYDGVTPTNFTPPSRTTTPTVDANTVSLWPMNEGYGTVAGDIGTNNNDGTISNGDWGSYPTADDKSPQANDGAYAGVVLANGALPSKIGGFAPYFDGVNDYVDLYSAALNTDFDPTLGTVFAWCKVANSGVWTDGSIRYLWYIAADAQNYVLAFKSSVNNTITVRYRANNITEAVNVSTSTTDWFQLGMNWNKAGDKVQVFFNGSQSGADQSGLGVWAGALAANLCTIGSDGTSPTQVNNGFVGHFGLLNSAATPAEILQGYNWGV